MADPGDGEIAAFAIAFYYHATEKTSVVGTWSIFKKEKSRRIWKPCERTSCVRQRALLSVCCQFLSVLQTRSMSQMHEITYNGELSHSLCQFFL